MEKIVNIDGRDVRLVCTAATPLMYKAAFGRDMFADLGSMDKSGKIENLNMEPVYRIIWALARGGDKKLPPLMDWLETFDEFPAIDIYNETSDMILRTMQLTKRTTPAPDAQG